MLEEVMLVNMNHTAFNRENTLLLVNLYELQPTLYCVSSPLYKDKNARDIAIKTITEQLFIKTKLKLSASEIREKINNLRTQFNEYYRKYEASIHSGMGAEEVEAAKPKWWLWEHLQFVKDGNKTRNATSSINVDEVCVME